MEFLPEAFAALGRYPQFINFSLEKNSSTNKLIKRPIDPKTHRIANAHDPAIQTDFQTALQSSKNISNGGIGFVLTSKDPFWFLDIDDCLAACGTKWSDLALQLLQYFNGAAVEISSSGKGLHIIGSGTSPAHACKNTDYGLEFYTENRFIALTGYSAVGSADTDFTSHLPPLVEAYFFGNYSSTQSGDIIARWEKAVDLGADPNWMGPLDDDDLISRALNSHSKRAIFGDTASFRSLWERNVPILQQCWPDPTKIEGYDDSIADASLAQHLAFWTGKDAGRMQRLMLKSKLYREKYDRKDYLPRTILNAISKQKDVLIDRVEPINTPLHSQSISTTPTLNSANKFLTVEQQMKLFDGCVYVSDINKILTPGGYLLSKEQFRVTYGGYSFPTDVCNERVTRNAWEAFTESQAFQKPYAHSTCFRPKEPPGAIIMDAGQALVNLWWPIDVPRVVGNADRFIDHIKRCYPIGDDWLMILSYIAAVVQFKGYKFQWAPILQGVEGNGKTLITRCVSYAVGERYSHFPKSSELADKFNDWMYGRLFIGIEDIYTQDKDSAIEALKPMITNERQEIQAKYGARNTMDIYCNFILNTNHKDGLRKTPNDRRFAPFFAAQQDATHLKRDGLDRQYFKEMFHWLKYEQGFAIVSELLHTFQIPDQYNPALGGIAPSTTSTTEAIEFSRGGIEQEIIEAIEVGRVGFRKGWISSIFLDKFLIDLKANRQLPQNRRRTLLQSLGYDWHPGLPEGRVNNDIFPDGGKPRLFIRADSLHRSLSGSAIIAEQYKRDQEG